MSQVNVTPGGPPVRDDTGDRTAAAGINFATMLIVLAIVVAVLFFLFSGPIGSFFRGGSRSSIDINVNTPGQTTQPTAPTGPNVSNPGPSAPSNPAPSNPAPSNTAPKP